MRGVVDCWNSNSKLLPGKGTCSYLDTSDDHGSKDGVVRVDSKPTNGLVCCQSAIFDMIDSKWKSWLYRDDHYDGLCKTRKLLQVFCLTKVFVAMKEEGYSYDCNR